MAAGGGGGQQKEISTAKLNTVYDEDDPEGVSQEDSHDTRAVLYDFVFTRATADEELTSQQKESFQEASSETEERFGSNGNGGSSSDNARMVGRRLAALGDEIDGMYKEQFEDIVGLYENPQEAFSSFSSVLGNLMNWEEGQLPTLGHIAAVLGYCYHLCKHHIQKFVGSHKLLSLLGMLAGFLVKFFLKAKVYEWVARQGGWGQLLFNSSGILNRFQWNNSYFLVISVVSLAAFVYFRFKEK